MDRILFVIDTINEWSGRIFSWIFLLLTLVVVLEVVMRYVFNSPIIGVWDIGGMLQGLIVIFGGGYTILHNGHVSVDILVNQLSDNKRFLVESITDFFTIVAIFLLLWKVCENALFSLRIKESYTSTWGPPIYPLKIAMTIGIVLMLLQAISSWIRKLKIVTRKNRKKSKA